MNIAQMLLQLKEQSALSTNAFDSICLQAACSKLVEYKKVRDNTWNSVGNYSYIFKDKSIIYKGEDNEFVELHNPCSSHLQDL